MSIAGIVEYFLNDFIPSLKEEETDFVDISKLVKFCNECSPTVPLRYTNSSESLKHLAATILLNFCKNYSGNAFPKSGIEILTEIIMKNIDVDDVIAQQILLVHIMKTKYDMNLSAFFVKSINEMKLQSVLSNYECRWKELASKVVKHKQINDFIEESMGNFDLPSCTRNDESNIKVTFVKNVTTILRGFCGFDEIFINAEHFSKKIDTFEGDNELLQLVAKMDIICVSLHEYAHVKIRKRTGDMNMSTPILAQNKGLSSSHNEFGVYNECRMFGKQVDWFLSGAVNGSELNINYIEQFITAIENGTKLPTLPTALLKGTLPRIASVGTGVDIYFANSIC